jgi:hypothetical protein
MILKKIDVRNKNRTITDAEMGLVIKSKIIGPVIIGPSAEVVMVTEYHNKVEVTENSNYHIG